MSDPTAGTVDGQDCAQLKGAQQLLCLVADPFSNTFHQIAVFSALGYSVGTMILITLAFSIMRPHNSVVYAPKLKYADDKHAPPRIGKGMFAWFWPVASIKEAELVEKVGLDAAVFLRFTKMCRNIFTLVTIVAIAILLPANVISSKKNVHGVVSHGFLTLSTPQYVAGPALWVHVVCAWAINIIVAFFLWRNYAAVTRLRRQYFESAEYLTALHSRTLMLTDISTASRTDEGILRLTDEVEQTSGLPRAAIARNVKELPELIEEHDQAVRELERVLAKYLKNPDSLPANRPTITPSKKYRKNNGGQKVDAIDYLTDRISELEMEIKHVRESIDKRNPMPFGFASYERIEDAHTVAYAAKKKHPHGTTIKMAPRPNDLIWKNLPLSKKDRNWKRFINNFWIAILTLIWIAPNALIGIFLSNLSNLANIWGGFKKEFHNHSTFWSIVQGIASPALTSLVYLILPIIFRRLSIHAGDTTKTSRERHVATKLYAFFVFNNLVVFSTFSVIFTFVQGVVLNPHHVGAWDAIKQGDFLLHLVYGLCQESPFWLTWLLQRNLGAAADLAQVLNLTWGWFNRTFMSPTPRQTIEWTAPPAIDYAVYYNYFLFYATVALCFVTVQPLVIPITAFYFAVDYWLKKYLLLYVLITKTESGGQYWRILFNRLVFATIFADFIIALILKSAGTWVMIGVMAPLPLLLIGFKLYCASTFDDQNEFYTRATLKDPEHLTDAGHKTRKNDRVGTKFGHPALYSKLITPMVHAKAQHVIAQVYRGRLNSENNMSTPMGYSDIAMDPMSRDVPGKTARFAPEQQKERNMFEVVPESHLDFGYFKDRTDFSEEHGGDGELYGRAQDLVSERSSTPRSFLGRDGGSPSSSRASSPGPEGDLGRQSPQEPRQMHPAYRDRSRQSSGGRGNLYSNGNESERDLLSAAQPVGTTENEQQYGLDRWRTGGTGYIGVPQGEETGYEAYRGGGR
ncbi:hypothetical protein HO173_002947 [Letharia columbiana]|uniref:DUF221-domain-containing protein n=1 Tax=Letharia columbiana TaxID=112416 RepID=A0A8H6G261_9LECA|nr:uncharacterized protein HO173_002947 [Letharia columbiana]KAF6239075.1 hypothetical protein HO173_002947 [Letharia columbiana]